MPEKVILKPKYEIVSKTQQGQERVYEIQQRAIRSIFGNTDEEWKTRRGWRNGRDSSNAKDA